MGALHLRIKSLYDFMKRDGVALKRKANIPIPFASDRVFGMLATILMDGATAPSQKK
jgi:hypothetical protein